MEPILAIKSLGIKELSAKIYLAGLGLGPTTIEKLSEKSGIKRTTIYGLLEELKKYGLVTMTKNGNRNMYQIEEPRQLMRICEDATENIKTSMPYFLNLWNSPSEKPKLNYMEGKLNLLKFIEEVEDSGCEFSHLAGTISHLNRILGYHRVIEFVKRKDARKIKRRILAAKELWIYDFIKKNPNNTREIRFLPDGTTTPVQIYLYEKRKCAFVTTDEQIKILIIDNGAIFKIQMTMFDALWKQSLEINTQKAPYKIA
jgi:sugar-specific transcriptional regulator TrmB